MDGPSVFFTPTPDRVIAEMLRLAKVGPGDVLYDLGCGDGRIVIAAALAGARGVGVDLDTGLLGKARAKAEALGVSNQVSFEQGDLFDRDLNEATVVALYLMDSLNVQLRPRILSQTAPGTRVVTYSFEMGEWECDEHTPIAANGVSLWIVPANIAGTWEVASSMSSAPAPRLLLEQRFQRFSGTFSGEKGQCSPMTGGITGTQVSLHLAQVGKEPVSYIGTIQGDLLVLTSEAGASLRAVRSPSAGAFGG